MVGSFKFNTDELGGEWVELARESGKVLFTNVQIEITEFVTNRYDAELSYEVPEIRFRNRVSCNCNLEISRNPSEKLS